MIETGQFTLHATFLAQPDKYKEMKAIARESFALTQDTPGLLQVLCLEPPKPDKPFVFVSIWQPKADFQAFLKTPAMREYHSQQAIKTMFETAIADSSADFYTIMDAWDAPH
ncbi:MAG: antibiotic biosynthesis monooxygenase [Anaerolineae bacterium]|nr:antibiotic biosynthesis monooxygenase [Anaerolineae bacterium]